MKFGLRETLFLALLLAIPIGAWWFVFRPHNAQIAEARQQIEAKRAKLQALNRATATLSNLKAEIDEYNKAIDFFQSKLPEEKEMDKVLKEVWQLAESSNLKAKSIRTLRRTRAGSLIDPSGPYAEQPILLELEGGFPGLYGFLLALEKTPRIIRIQDMKLDKLDKVDESEMKAQLTLSIFFERNG